MSKQPSGSVPQLPWEKDGARFTPREGQSAVIEYLRHQETATQLNVQFPGGYGKTAAIAMAYFYMKHVAKRVDRLMIVVANDTQRRQILNDFTADCRVFGFEIAGGVWQFTKEPATQRANREGLAEVFVVTIQGVSSTNRAEIDLLMQLLRDGGWMIAADEYHHYATERDWGVALGRVIEASRFTIALSATPARDGPATIFGAPHISVTYLEAKEESAVKELVLSCFHYHVEAFVDGGTEHIATYTTDDLLNDPEVRQKGIDVFEERHGLRYTGKYISEILNIPLARLAAKRSDTGLPLQALVKAMSCRHAAFLSDTIKQLNYGFRVDWIGTGKHGRAALDNEAICRAFCPPKGQDGIRPTPTLDILVQVAMAGEGFDSLPVAEAIDLSLVTLDGAANQERQFIYRMSRWYHGVTGCLNVPSDNPMASIPGRSLMAWLDNAEPTDAYKPKADADNTVPPISLEAFERFLARTQIHREVELYSVSSDNEHFAQFYQRAKADAEKYGCPFDPDNNESDRASVVTWYRTAGEIVTREQSEMSHQARMQECRDELGRLCDRLVSQTVAAIYNGHHFPRSVLGDYAKRINTQLKNRIGERSGLITDDEYRACAALLAAWSADIADGHIPGWLR